MIVVEVLSPGTATRDLHDKLVGYFRVPSILHYLIVDTERRIVLHHHRGEGDIIETRVVIVGEAISGDGTLTLVPPGITLAVADLFEPRNVGNS